MSDSCARCLAGRCRHEECRTRDYGKEALTQVAGTSCCGDCAPALLDLVVGPLDALAVLAADVSPGPFTHQGMGVCNKGRVHDGPCDYGNGI